MIYWSFYKISNLHDTVTTFGHVSYVDQLCFRVFMCMNELLVCCYVCKPACFKLSLAGRIQYFELNKIYNIWLSYLWTNTQPNWGETSIKIYVPSINCYWKTNNFILNFVIEIDKYLKFLKESKQMNDVLTWLPTFFCKVLPISNFTFSKQYCCTCLF